MCILNTNTPYIHRPKHQDPNHTRSPPEATIARRRRDRGAKTDARGGRADLISPADDERDATHLSGELNTSRPGERDSKALPRRPMRDDAGSDPSARDAARGVIGLSAFANNRKGDARSADTCASARSMTIRRRQSRITRMKRKKYSPIPHRVLDRRIRSPTSSRATLKIRHPSSSSRTNKHRKTRGKTKRASRPSVSSSSHARHPSVAPVVPASSPRRRRSSRRFAPRSHPRPRSPRVASRVVARTSSRVALASRPSEPSARPPVLSRVSERFPIVRTTT